MVLVGTQLALSQSTPRRGNWRLIIEGLCTVDVFGRGEGRGMINGRWSAVNCAALRTRQGCRHLFIVPIVHTHVSLLMPPAPLVLNLSISAGTRSGMSLYTMILPSIAESGGECTPTTQPVFSRGSACAIRYLREAISTVLVYT